MKANETKSKFVFPDKLYARTNDNITLDISYAPQTLEAVEYVIEDAFIKKAAEWIKNKADKYIVDTPLCCYFDYKRAVEDFKDYMKVE